MYKIKVTGKQKEETWGNFTMTLGEQYFLIDKDKVIKKGHHIQDGD